MGVLYEPKRVNAHIPEDFSTDGTTSRVSIPYYVEFAAKASPYMALNARGVPQPGANCPWCTRLYYSSASVETLNGKQYIVTVEFVNLPGGKDASKAKDYPWDNPPDITCGSERRQIVAEKAYANKGDDEPTIAILNSAGDFFNNPPQLTVSDGRFDIAWNVRRFSMSSTYNYRDTVNLNSVTLCEIPFDTGELYMASLDATPCQTDEGVKYYAIRASILSRRDGDAWRFVPVDAGWKAKVDTAHPVRVYITNEGRFVAPDSNYEPVSEQVLLNGNGGILAYTQDAMRNATPKFLDFDIIRAVDWSGLGLPTSRGGIK